MTDKTAPTNSQNAGAINIVIEEYEGKPDVSFVEIENDKGESIRIGERIQKDDGFVCIRITAEEIINHKSI